MAEATATEKLWSEEVEIAEVGEVEEFPAYQFSNGRKFEAPESSR
jgi:hypothetical protein